ncbi:BTAD domain-containing putative transcriptional regulator [Actinoplanes derwentensis]|uniref:AAA ATPase domain-containing protein n=1 Tax=Actinoplanes derwentensis TaxID=113562 RepID=A0A1H1RBM1_9ACTN|nr:BTAD domain-containing putative transcriptional regulator [Actinoplanes derwentensis]GID88049.1 hypothetical protein Ade03nite_69730 [Actinoplanes derwentensis]SDS32319.1 AAA ATPase domain-containing protein [Actinoplanes derwentensis]
MMIKLVGTVMIESLGAAPRQLASAQAQVAFARLIIERASGTGRDQLADTVWPDGLPDTWASALRSVVSRVRAFVSGGDCDETPPVVAQGGRYLLRLPVEATVDLERAEEAIREADRAFSAGAYPEARHAAGLAISWLSSPFLPGHEGEWVVSIRERLHGFLVSGLETASLAAAALGDYREALRFADEAVREAPLRESAHRCRMTAHAAAGNRAEALGAYHRLRRMLADELGVDPAPETQVAYVELLGTGGTVQRPETSGRIGDTIPFVGRAAELDTVAESWAAAVQGQARVILVEGPAGIGKSRFLGKAAKTVARAGGMVIFGRCNPNSNIPYQPYVDALSALVSASGDDGSPGLNVAARAALNTVADATRPGPVHRATLAAAIVDGFSAISRDQPVLLLLENLEAIDHDSMTLFSRLLCEDRALPLLVLGTACTPSPVTARVVQALSDADVNCVMRRVMLGGLDDSEVLRLMRTAVPDATGLPTPKQLIADTAGNPYLLLELLRRPRGGHADDLPPTVLEFTAARLEQLGDAARVLLRPAATAGPVFELDLVAEAAGLGPAQAFDALTEAVAHGWIAEAPDARPGYRGRLYRFVQDVLRRAVYLSSAPARRNELHTRLADAIESRRAGTLAGYSMQLAHHRAHGAAPAGDARAVRWGWRAAAAVADQGSAEEAVRLHRQALGHVPAGEPDLFAEALINLGLAQLTAGDTAGEQNLLDGAIRSLHRGNAAMAARAVLGLSEAVMARPRLRSEVIALLDSLVRDRAGDLEPVLYGRLLCRRARLGAPVHGRPSATRAALDAMGRRLGELTGPDHLAGRHELALEMLDLAVAAGDPSAQLLAAHHAAMAADLAGTEPARLAALAALGAATRLGADAAAGSAVGSALFGEHLVAEAVSQGRFVDALAAARMVRPVREPFPGVDPAPGTVAARQLLIARWLRAGCWPTWDESFARGLAAVEHSLTTIVGGERGMPHLTIRALATGALPLPEGDDLPHVLGILAMGAVELGDPYTAEAMRALLTPYTSYKCGVGYRSFAGPVSLHLGRLAVLTGDWPAAERHLTVALVQLTERGAKPWIALAQQSMARALEGRGRPADRRHAEAFRREAAQTLATVSLRRPALAV